MPKKHSSNDDERPLNGDITNTMFNRQEIKKWGWVKTLSPW
jgi:hypothetical protein